MDMPAERAMESVTNLVTLNGALGNYSIGLHLALAFGAMLFFVATVAAIVKLRGQGNALVTLCVLDVLYAICCALLIFTFPGCFFFLGRSLWRSLTWHTEATE